MLTTRPPAPTISPARATIYCTRPARGAFNVLSSICTSIASIVAWAAVTAASAPITEAFADATPARAAASDACAEATAAAAPKALARSISNCRSDVMLFCVRDSERSYWRRATSSSARRCSRRASAARTSAARCSTSSVAFSTAISARRSSATIWLRLACNCRVSSVARGAPAVTSPPSFTSTVSIRPGSLAATSISTASIRPLPRANPSASVSDRVLCQIKKPDTATAMTIAAMITGLFFATGYSLVVMIRACFLFLRRA